MTIEKKITLDMKNYLYVENTLKPGQTTSDRINEILAYMQTLMVKGND